MNYCIFEKNSGVRRPNRGQRFRFCRYFTKRLFLDGMKLIAIILCNLLINERITSKSEKYNNRNRLTRPKSHKLLEVFFRVRK